LTVISHIRGYIGISKLIDSFQRTGVAPLPQSRLYEACGDLITAFVNKKLSHSANKKVSQF